MRCQGLSAVHGAIDNCVSTNALRRPHLEIQKSSRAHGWATNKSIEDSSALVIWTVCRRGPKGVICLSTTSFCASLKCLRSDGPSSKLGSRLISLIQAEHAEADAKGSFRRADSSFLSLDARSILERDVSRVQDAGQKTDPRAQAHSIRFDSSGLNVRVSADC